MRLNFALISISHLLQKIDGASVSLWRELRIIRTKLFNTDTENQSSVLEQARFAAGNSDWQDYTTTMGGARPNLKIGRLNYVTN